MTLLSLRDLSVERSGKPVLQDVSLTVSTGEFVGLIGPNGAGKSTLLSASLGLIPSRGSVLLSGQDFRSLDAVQRALLVSYLPQEQEVAWSMSVEHLVRLGRSPHRAAFRQVGQADTEAVESAMQTMDVGHLRARPATELSGGERARVLVARALAQQAPLLLADEPTSGLDPAHQIALMRTFARLADQGSGVVACLHDLSLAARWCSRIVMLSDGCIVADGHPQAILTRELLRKLYHVETYLADHAGGPIVLPYDLLATDRTPA